MCTPIGAENARNYWCVGDPTRSCANAQKHWVMKMGMCEYCYIGPRLGNYNIVPTACPNSSLTLVPKIITGRSNSTHNFCFSFSSPVCGQRQYNVLFVIGECVCEFPSLSWISYTITVYATRIPAWHSVRTVALSSRKLDLQLFFQN